jgi:hypothetical protein
LLAAGQQALSVLLDAVAACQRAGRVPGDDPKMVALAGWALSHGLASLHADGILGAAFPMPLEDIARAVVPMLIQGVRAPNLPAGPRGRVGVRPR